MKLLSHFIYFFGEILEFKVLGIDLFAWLIAVTIISFVFKLISILGNSNFKNKKEKDKGDEK